MVLVNLLRSPILSFRLNAIRGLRPFSSFPFTLSYRFDKLRDKSSSGIFSQSKLDFTWSSTSESLDCTNADTKPTEFVSFAYRPRIIFILGGPGAGKGTQCEKLAHSYGMTHLSAGELLRQERQSGSENGKLIEQIIGEGEELCTFLWN
jgi:UMP-CMP kinase